MQDTVCDKLGAVLEAVGQVIVGQREPLEKMLIALLCNGHALLEGVPGIAKTMMVKNLAQALCAQFSRIQFTPDLLPGDLVGTQVYRHETGTFETHRGPVFANVVLADEINRSPAKVQSALLEAMQERQVTLGGHTHKLPEPFMVLATQNPIEQEGTYSLPEAQIDRFMFKLLIQYPTHDEEHEIMRRVARTNPVTTVGPVATLQDVLAMRETLDAVHLDEKIELYILRLVAATRDPATCGLAELSPYVRFGASPRASIYLALAARGHALVRRRDYVVPDDVKAMVHDVVRHRIAISYRAEAEGLNSDALLDRIVERVPINDVGVPRAAAND
jgi:MoxR-like ATPase